MKYKLMNIDRLVDKEENSPKQSWTLHQVLTDNVCCMVEMAGDFFCSLLMKTPFFFHYYQFLVWYD